MHFFEEAYEGSPPWDIGGPQPEFVRLAEGGEIRGRVLDAGCGGGENALYLASRGYDVCGIDTAGAAIERARVKASERGLEATFVRADVLSASRIDTRFDTVIDSGLFHVFSDEERARYVKRMTELVQSGGVFHMLCFSELEPGDWGPRRVTQKEIREAFRAGWIVVRIAPARFETNLEQGSAAAWLSKIIRRANARKPGGKRRRRT